MCYIYRKTLYKWRLTTFLYKVYPLHQYSALTEVLEGEAWGGGPGVSGGGGEAGSGRDLPSQGEVHGTASVSLVKIQK